MEFDAWHNYDGATIHLRYDWQATGKLALSVLVQRDISPDEDVQNTFVLIKGIAFGASSALSEKVKLRANADFSIGEYLGDHGLAPRRAFAFGPFCPGM